MFVRLFVVQVNHSPVDDGNHAMACNQHDVKMHAIAKPTIELAIAKLMAQSVICNHWNKWLMSATVLLGRVKRLQFIFHFSNRRINNEYYRRHRYSSFIYALISVYATAPSSMYRLFSQSREWNYCRFKAGDKRNEFKPQRASLLVHLHFISFYFYIYAAITDVECALKQWK